MRYNHLFASLVLAATCSAAVARAQTAVDDVARRASAERVRPGDLIQVQFTQDKEFNSSTVVNADGQAVLPKLGSVPVAEITIGALPDTLRARYGEYLRDPELDVTVLRRVTVNGEVRQPNVYMLDVNSIVRDAIARAGGLIETSQQNNVVVVRGSQRIRVHDWQHNTGPEADLMSGDQVIVARKSWLSLNALPVISTSVIVIGLIRSLRH